MGDAAGRSHPCLPASGCSGPWAWFSLGFVWGGVRRVRPAERSYPPPPGAHLSAVRTPSANGVSGLPGGGTFTCRRQAARRQRGRWEVRYPEGGSTPTPACPHSLTAPRRSPDVATLTAPRRSPSVATLTHSPAPLTQRGHTHSQPRAAHPT